MVVNFQDKYDGPVDFIQLFLEAEAEENWKTNNKDLKWEDSKAAGIRVEKKLTIKVKYVT